MSTPALWSLTLSPRDASPVRFRCVPSDAAGRYLVQRSDDGATWTDTIVAGPSPVTLLQRVAGSAVVHDALALQPPF